MVFNLKWWGFLASLASISAIIQFIKWGLDSLTGEKLQTQVSLLFSLVFGALILIGLVIVKIQQDNNKIKEFLNLKEFKEDKMNLLKNKKGWIDIDARILLIIFTGIFLYFLYRAFR